MAKPPEPIRRRAYEARDASIRPLALFLLSLALLNAVIFAGIFFLFRYLARQATLSDQPPSPLAATRPAVPEPRLQVTPAADLASVRAAEDEQLSSYGWIDKPLGKAHIPIRRAMGLVLDRGLPVRPQTATPRHGGTR